MHTHQKSSDPVATLGLDIGKNTFHLVGLDQRGAIAMRIKVSRNQLIRRLVNLPPCLIGLEAGSGSHHIARQIKQLGHDVRLIPAQYVKPFLKGHKNDYRDAEAIAEAVQRPTMNFVAIKTPSRATSLAPPPPLAPCPPAYRYHQPDPRLSHRTRHHGAARSSTLAQGAT